MEFTEILKIVIFQTFQKLRKNDVKLKLQKLQKTCSNSKTDSKVWLKVQNAGPYKQPCLKAYPYLRKWPGCRLCLKVERRMEYPVPDTNFQGTESIIK